MQMRAVTASAALLRTAAMPRVAAVAVRPFLAGRFVAAVEPRLAAGIRRCSSKPGGGSTGGAGSSSSSSAGASTPFYKNPIAWWKENNAKVKALFKQYGVFAVSTYLGVYVVTLFSLFGIVSAGAVQGPDINAFLAKQGERFGIERLKTLHLSPAVSNFLTAWLLTKTTEPVRLATTIVLVPVLARKLPPSVLRFFRVPAEAIAASHGTATGAAGAASSSSSASAGAAAAAGTAAASSSSPAARAGASETARKALLLLGVQVAALGASDDFVAGAAASRPQTGAGAARALC